MIRRLFELALVVAVISRTVTKEEVFREWREMCARHAACGTLPKRKLCYVFTCTYCFSHWVSLGVVVASGFHFVCGDWRGLIMAIFAMVGIANLYAVAYEILTLAARAIRNCAC